jgi:hypothetical protein
VFGLDTSPERKEQLANAARKWGFVVFACGLTAPTVLRRVMAARAYVDRRIAPWPDDPGWMLKLVGSTMLNESDRRRARS